MKSRMSGLSVQEIVGVLCCLVACCSACFIRNCPLGGKRSMDNLHDISPRRECMGCGPNLEGQCIGPNICCGGSIGCFMNTEETEVCQKENDNPAPCDVKGADCGKDSQGRCVVDGICCTDEYCKLDSTCEGNAVYPVGIKRNLNPELLRYIRRLMQERGGYNR